MARKRMETPEEIMKKYKEGQFSNYKLHADHYPKNPTRSFDVGERVSYGNWQETIVEEVLEDGLGYGIRSKSIVEKKPLENEDKVKIQFTYVPWFRLYPMPNSSNNSSFTSNEDLKIYFNNTTIESLISTVYNFGVDFDPEYQRGDVWDDSDREALLDSIFMGADIGKFLFAEREWDVGEASYEIVDGKQRLKTLCAFYEDRLQYRGYYYSQLSGKDKRTFKEHGALSAKISNTSKDVIIRYFLMLNRGGKPMDEEWLRHVEGMLKEDKK